MNQLAEYLFSMWGYWLAGVIVAAAGGLMLWGAGKAEPGSRKVMRWIGFPTIGCGAILFIMPFIAFAGVLLIGGGIVVACQHMAGC